MSQERLSNGRLDASPRADEANGTSENGPHQGAESPGLSSAVQDILQKLSSTTESCIDLCYVDMTEEEAQRIGEAIALSQHLEELTLQLDSMVVREDRLQPAKIILSRAFLCPQPNTSVKNIIIAGSGTDGDLMYVGALPEVLRRNSHLESLEIKWHGDDGTSRDDTRELFNSLLENTTLRRLVLPSLVRWDFEDREDNGFIDAETFSQLVELIKDNKSVMHLELQVGECRGPGSENLNLPAFYRALQLNSTLKIVELRWKFLTRNAENEFLGWIRASESLQELHLLELCEYEDDEEEPLLLYNHIFLALQDNRTLRKLVVESASVESEENFRELLKAISLNVRLEEVVFEPEPDEDVEQAVREALQGRGVPTSSTDS